MKISASIRLPVCPSYNTSLPLCLNPNSDKLSLSFERWGRTNTRTAVCNSNWGSWGGDWHVVHKMHGVVKYYFQMNPEVQFKNPVSSKQGFNSSCPSLGDARNMLPGQTCITYESLGSRAVSGNACSNKGCARRTSPRSSLDFARHRISP